MKSRATSSPLASSSSQPSAATAPTSSGRCARGGAHGRPLRTPLAAPRGAASPLSSPGSSGPGDPRSPQRPECRRVHSRADSRGELGEPVRVRTPARNDSSTPGAGLPGKSPPGSTHTHTHPATGGRLSARRGDTDPVHPASCPCRPGRNRPPCRQRRSRGVRERGKWKGESRGQSFPEKQPGSNRGRRGPRGWRAGLGACRAAGGGFCVFCVSYRACTLLEPWVPAYCSLYLLGTERL